MGLCFYSSILNWGYTMSDGMNDKKITRLIQSYILGFLFSLFLTVIPFFLVSKKIFCYPIVLFTVIICAIVQVYIHLKYFLHLNFTKRNFWNIIFLIFALIVVCIIILGSVWIMHNLHNHIFYDYIVYTI